jgi:hypothetical protein
MTPGMSVAKSSTTGRADVRALLVDPSLFTAPYDASLTEGLVAAGVEPTWAVRPTRAGDRQEIPARYCEPFFYKGVDGVPGLSGRFRKVAKGASHVLGLARLVWRALITGPDVVHFQWAVVARPFSRPPPSTCRSASATGSSFTPPAPARDCSRAGSQRTRWS